MALGSRHAPKTTVKVLTAVNEGNSAIYKCLHCTIRIIVKPPEYPERGQGAEGEARVNLAPAVAGERAVRLCTRNDVCGSSR